MGLFTSLLQALLVLSSSTLSPEMWLVLSVTDVYHAAFACDGHTQPSVGVVVCVHVCVCPPGRFPLRCQVSMQQILSSQSFSLFLTHRLLNRVTALNHSRRGLSCHTPVERGELCTDSHCFVLIN